MSLRLFILFITCFVFTIIVGSGFYGYGIDFHGLYTRPNLDMGDYRNWLGYRLSSLTIYNTHIGLYFLTLCLSLSCSLLINEFLKQKLIHSKIYLFLILIITFHTWPIIMSATNAMRQGYANSLVFLALILIFQKKIKLSFVILTFSIFLHKTGIFFVMIFLTTFPVKAGLNSMKRNSEKLFLALSVLMCIFAFYFLYLLFLDTGKNFRVVNGDFRIPFLIINISFIFFYIIFLSALRENDIYLFLFVFSCAAIPVLMIDYNWQYERLNMMMTIPYILTTGKILNLKSVKIYWLVALSVLLFLTLHQGMYQALTDEFTFKEIRGL